MLVLHREKNESLIFTVDGKEIELVILSAGNRVRVGINAPREIRVTRGEHRDTPPTQGDAK